MPETSPLIPQLASDGTIYVLDGKARAILKLNQQGQVAGKVAPKGIPGSKTIIPRSFRLDQKGDIYLLDIHSERVVILGCR